MDFQIVSYRNSSDEDQAIASLLIQSFIEEGYTDRATMAQLISPTEFRKRGKILLGRSISETGEILGMVILAQRPNLPRQVAKPNEAELQLLAVNPIARGQGLGSRLVKACEQNAAELGYQGMVLSTQPGMKAAHRVYERLNYRRNPMRDWARSNGRSFLVYEKLLI